MNVVEVFREAPEGEAARTVFETVLAGAGSHRAVLLQFQAEEMARYVRRAAARSADPAAPGHAAEHWLQTHLRQNGDGVRRAATAALALGLDRRVAALPSEMRTAYPVTQARLAVSLKAKRAYGFDLFAKDIALVSGLVAPVGAMRVVIPDRRCPESLPLRTRRAAGGFVRQVMQYGPGTAHGWLADTGARPWVELHLDLRVLDAFNPAGFLDSYHRLAVLMRTRSDLAGLFGASWLYDPRLADISPGLAFVRRTAEDGGARVVRLKADPVQTAFAMARSPARRKLVESGAYRPLCYAMYWRAADLIAWSERTLAESRSPTPPLRGLEPDLQVVRK